MNKIAPAIKKVFQNAKSALLVSHVDPDGDSIGSMLAMGMYLTQLGIKVDYYSKDGIPRVYRFLVGIDQVRNKIPANRRYDLLLAMDSSDVKRLGNDLDLHQLAKVVINIDHHPDNTNYGDINYVELSSSTAELVYKLFKALQVKISQAMAENLYVALITDTGNYRYENTGINTFIMAADLLKAGVDPHHVSTKIYDTKTIVSIRIHSLALSTLEISPDRKAAWVVVTHEMMEKIGAKGEDLIGLVDQVRSIEGVEVAILFREEGGKVKINFRSKEKINVSAIAKKFGGGGHVRAAGVILNCNIAEAKRDVIQEALRHIKASKYLV